MPNKNMKIVNVLLLFILLNSISSFAFGKPICGEKDEECKQLEHFSDMQKDEKIIEMVDPKKTYSKGSLFYIGLAFKTVASKTEDTSPAEAEQLYRKAIEFKYYKAYMGLYNLYINKNTDVALQFIKSYVDTNPNDPDPYFILGELEFKKENYKLASKHLMQSKKLSKGHTSSIDWLLFQVNYMTGDYKYSSQMLGDALAQGNFTDELKKIKSDPRFADIDSRPEFKEYRQWFK